jgi:hypothetical protein
MFVLLLLSAELSLAQRNTSAINAVGSETETPVAISFETILDRLINSPDSLIAYHNKSIDLGSYTLRKIDRLFANANIDSGLLILNKSLEFYNCHISGKGLSDLNINSITFENCRISSLNISNLKVSALKIVGGSLNKVRILNSTFNHLEISDLINTKEASSYISLFKSNVRNQLLISNNKYYQNIGIFSSELVNVRLNNNMAQITGMANNLVLNELLLLEETADEFRIRKNTFSSSDTLRYTFDINCEKLVFIENQVDVAVLFADSRVAVQVEMADNHFFKPVDFHDVSFPEFGKYVPFSQFDQGFVVYQNLYGEDSPDGANCYYCEIYNGETDDELADKTNFDKLVQSYEILFLGYKASGDIESANLSYIKIKDLYLNRLGFQYRTNGGFKNFFRWKLAQLLKYYTNHGTDPALSIVISIYVVLIFAVFYVFYPSEWDVTSKARLIADFRDFIDKNDKGRFKPFMALLAGFGISLINAITLSINSFVTLGFGTIPTTGAARYICILQGFIGWFLLSIFTVSLINQILF